MAGILGADGPDHQKLRGDHVQLLADFFSDPHKLSAAQAAFMLFGNVDHNFFTGKCFG